MEAELGVASHCLPSTCRLSNLTLSSQLLRQLAYRGFRMFHSEVNFFEPGNVFELAFIHESLVQPRSAA